MKKILVYGATEREARRHYVAKQGETVGERTYADYGNGEKADEYILVDESKVNKKTAVDKKPAK